MPTVGMGSSLTEYSIVHSWFGLKVVIQKSRRGPGVEAGPYARVFQQFSDPLVKLLLYPRGIAGAGLPGNVRPYNPIARHLSTTAEPSFHDHPGYATRVVARLHTLDLPALLIGEGVGVHHGKRMPARQHL
jgi:hypothetical protein